MQNNKSLEFQSLTKEENNYLGKLILQKMSVEDYMNNCEDGHPAVYVGTYAKYNDGSLFGMWVDMVKCGDYDTFIEVCHNLHADEEDPELMYQDYECFPGAWYMAVLSPGHTCLNKKIRQIPLKSARLPPGGVCIVFFLSIYTTYY